MISCQVSNMRYFMGADMTLPPGGSVERRCRAMPITDVDPRSDVQKLYTLLIFSHCRQTLACNPPVTTAWSANDAESTFHEASKLYVRNCNLTDCSSGRSFIRSLVQSLTQLLLPACIVYSGV